MVSLEKQLDRFRTVRAGPRSDAAIRELAALIQAPQPHAIILKPVADLALAWEAKELLDPLANAIATLMGPEAAKRDPGCMGKIAALTTLIELGSEHAELMLRGITYKQKEPTHGGSIDTAASFRGLCGMGLVKMRYKTPVPLLIDLLADEEKDARVYAAMALGFWPCDESVAVLRLKALLDDESAEVMGEVFLGLLRIDPQQQLAFVLRFMNHEKTAVVEAAALALGQSHCNGAMTALTTTYGHYKGHGIASSLLMAIAMLRHEEAIAFLISVVQTAASDQAIQALDALAMYKHDPKIVDRIREAVGTKHTALKVFQEVFGQ